MVPYRDREQQRLFFQKQMADVLSDMPPESCRVWFLHQRDQRPFNRGALKNIGALIAQQKYPNHWRDITLVFNDVDTMPFAKNYLQYETRRGIIKHFYGFTFALGGIVSVTGHDFAQVDGFPNYWAWGYEDNALQQRADRHRIPVDRGQFHPVLDKSIMHFHDGLTRSVNREEFDRYRIGGRDGLGDIRDLRFVEEPTPADRADPVVEFAFMHIDWFTATTPPPVAAFETYDLTTRQSPFSPTDPLHAPPRTHVAMTAPRFPPKIPRFLSVLYSRNK